MTGRRRQRDTEQVRTPARDTARHEQETDGAAHADAFEPERSHPAAGESREWRAGYGAYGLGQSAAAGEEANGSNRRTHHDLEHQQRAGRPRSGYAEQGFGAGEIHGSWGGGRHGGYGGGEAGGARGGWSSADERYEQGRGPRSYGPGGWGAGAPWAPSEFAGRGEFGAAEPGAWAEERGYSTGPHAGTARERWSVPGPHTGRGPEGYRRAESAIHDDVCERLTRHGELDATRITVHVENGEVTLDGFVDSRASKRMAEDTAESVFGVRDVHNRLRIDGGMNGG